VDRKRRPLFLFVLAAFLLFLGLVFQQFLVDDIVLPVATVVWLVLRITILSIDQQVYWWALIGFIVLLLSFRLLRGWGTLEPDRAPRANPTLEHIHYWRTLILSGPRADGEEQAVRRNLIELLTTLYTTGAQGSTRYMVREAIQDRRLVLPDPVYAFLFPQAESPRPSFLRHPVEFMSYRLRSMQQAPARWMRRWSGRETTEYLAAIDQALILMESTWEIKHGDEPFTREH
jgi:hypothetical protein